MTSPLKLSPSDQEHLIDKLQVFKIHGRDKRGRKVLCIIGKLFPGNKKPHRQLIGFFVWIRITFFFFFGLRVCLYKLKTVFWAIEKKLGSFKLPKHLNKRTLD